MSEMIETLNNTAYPLLPLRDVVVFPHMIVPLFVGRDKSIKALEEVMSDNRQILLVTQKEASADNPEAEDLYVVGTLATIIQFLKLPDGTVKILVEGQSRVRLKEFFKDQTYLKATVEEIQETIGNSQEVDPLKRTLISVFEQYGKLNPSIPKDVIASIAKIEEAGRLADTAASYLSLKVSEKQELLEIPVITDRLERIYGYIDAEISSLEVEKRIRDRIKKQMEKTQREYYLNEQMKAIQKELSEGGDEKDELSELEGKIKNLKCSDDVREKALSELKKLRMMNPMSSEATVIRNYLDWIICLPWHTPSPTTKNLKKSEKVLADDHYGLEKVKERILEQIAVLNRVGATKGTILCLVGPPGVGKTSLGKSIARATGRSFVRVSLGGVRDEAEIRGHRRTYIGSMPGKIIQAMKKAKTSNPVILLDEIDKLGADWRGDPASALLEVLDPEQNSAFNDHYLEVDYDLSDVLFITTANTLNMPQPLMDRMEIIRISGYTEEEKVEIAERHLLPKVRKSHGLKPSEWVLERAAIRDLIRYYTREAGVRSLEREIAKTARKAIKTLMMQKEKKVVITSENLAEFAGVRRHRFGEIQEQDLVGITTGLAWTEVGGEILSIEAVILPGKGKMTITGKLGDVMQESVQAAASFVRFHAKEFGIQPDFFEKHDIHVHVPEGATPKDGPSAGVAMCASIVSVLTGIPVRRDVAMTGEITLSGRVLPIGGLKEKLLAAQRGGIKKVLIPQENQRDLSEIPAPILEGLQIFLMSRVEEVLKEALVSPLKALDIPPKEGLAVSNIQEVTN